MPAVQYPSTQSRSLSTTHRGPIIALLLLAPIISELLYGAIRISTIFILIPEVLTWGCGALLVRECIRRWRKGWPSTLLLGLAIAVAEEWVIQQTSIAPLVGLAKHAYGRVWGVNWVYFLWALGYESVWVVLLPVQLTELLFPDQRDQPWLRKRGFVAASSAFAVGCFAAWYGWTQRARVRIFHMAPYSPPPLYIAGAIVVIVLLFWAAYRFPSRKSSTQTATHATSPWLVGSLLTLFAFAWSAFVLLGYGSIPGISFEVPLIAGMALAACTLFLIRRWTDSPDWGDEQRFAVVFSGVLGCMLGGFVVFAVSGALPVDWIGKVMVNAIATALLIWAGNKISDRARINRSPNPGIA